MVQSAALALASTAFATIVAWRRPFVSIEGSFLGVRIDVLNSSEIVASVVVALNQWIFLLARSGTVSRSDAWGLPLTIVNLVVLAALILRVAQPASRIRNVCAYHSSQLTTQNLVMHASTAN